MRDSRERIKPGLGAAVLLYRVLCERCGEGKVEAAS
jgi:hypothetical protein